MVKVIKNKDVYKFKGHEINLDLLDEIMKDKNMYIKSLKYELYYKDDIDRYITKYYELNTNEWLSFSKNRYNVENIKKILHVMCSMNIDYEPVILNTFKPSNIYTISSDFYIPNIYNISSDFYIPQFTHITEALFNKDHGWDDCYFKYEINNIDTDVYVIKFDLYEYGPYITASGIIRIYLKRIK